MSGTHDAIVQAGPADIQPVAGLIAEAFHPLHAAQWLVPDPEERRAAMAGQFAILVEHALAFGHVDLLADWTGAAVWLHHTGPIPDPPDYDQRLSVACGQYADRFRILDALFEQHHPDEPHHYLAMLAVAGDRQGTGRGTLLLRAHHEVLDAQATPAYLEASGIRSAHLYHRLGYRPRGEPFALPNEAFFYPMWRAPVHPDAGSGADAPIARSVVNAPPVPPSAARGGPVRRVVALA